MAIWLDEVVSRLEELDLGKKTTRNLSIAKRYFGFDGGGCVSTSEIASSTGLQSETIRHITQRVSDLLHKRVELVPSLPGLYDRLASETPADAELLSQTFHEEGLLPERFAFQGVISALDLFGINACGLQLLQTPDSCYLISEQEGEKMGEARKIAVKRVSKFGVCSVHELCDEVFERSDDGIVMFVMSVLSERDGFKLIDGQDGWFYFGSRGNNKVISRVDKAFSYYERIPVEKLKLVLERSLRSKLAEKVVIPPISVICSMVETHGIAFLKGNDEMERNASYGFIEAPKEMELLLANTVGGSPIGTLREKELEDKVVGTNGKKYAFSQALNFSPLIVKIDRGVYGLAGHHVQREVGL